MKDLKEYQKAYYQAHKEQLKEQRKAYRKAYYQAHKEEKKAWREANKEKIKAYYKANKAYWKAWNEAHKEECYAYKNEYIKSDLNLLGQTKHSIRQKSQRILKKSGIKIPGYEIHHCFGYEDPSKFIYISYSLHLKIHQFLRDNNINADTDHWMAIRDLVNSTDEFMYIKC